MRIYDKRNTFRGNWKTTLSDIVIETMKTLVNLVLLSLLASSTSALRKGNLTAIFSTILSAIDDVQTIISQGDVPIQGPPQEIALLKQFVEDMESISFDEGDGSLSGFQQEEFETELQGAEGEQSFGDDNFCKVGLKNVKLILPPSSRVFSVGGKTVAVLRARAFQSNQTLLIQTSIKGKPNLWSHLTGLKERSPPQTFPADNHLPRPSLVVALTEAIGDFSFQMIHRVLKEALERTTGDRTDHLTRLIRVRFCGIYAIELY